MKLKLYAVFTLVILLGSNAVFAQQELIDKIFTGKPADFKSQIVIEDTIGFDILDNLVSDYYSIRFGPDSFERFLTYRNKTTNKVGLIAYCGAKSDYTDAVADSIYFLQNKDIEYAESYDEEGNYVYNTIIKSMLFYFDYENSKDEYWVVLGESAKCSIKKGGNVEKDLFKAVSFTENINEEGTTVITGIYANLRTNEVFNSAVLNEKVTINEVYAYHYDYYGEYDYYYSYEQPESDYSVPYFETRMTYEPIEIVYCMAGDSISDVLTYTYPESDLTAFNKKAVPDEYSGVWKSNDDYGTMLIFDGDDIWSAYGVFVATIDSYKDLYTISKPTWADLMTQLNLPAEDLKTLESGWKGSKTDLRCIELTTFVTLGRFKDFYISNDEFMAHVYLESDGAGNVSAGFEFLNEEKVFEDFGFAYYDNYTYTTVLKDDAGNTLNLLDAGVEYYYNYNLGVADRNIDKDGNLILTNEALGSIQFRAFSGGSNYVGKVRYQWIGSEKFNGDARMVAIKSLPYKIMDQSGKVMADDVFSMYVTNVQGFNLYQIYNSDNKVGVLGPDGTWMIKQEWDGVNILGPSASYGYDGYGSISLPVFFMVMKGDKYGAQDSRGNWVIPMGYDYIEVCNEQLLATKDGKISIYSFDGKMLIENLDGFSGGYYGYATDCYSFDYTATGSRILVKDNLYGVVDENFNVTVPFKYVSIASVGTGNKFIAVNEEGLSGMIDSKNNVILDFEYDMMVPFDYNQNRLMASKDGKQGVIDQNGKVIIPFEFYSITTSSDWSSNMIYISDPDYRTNIVDTTGKSIIDAGCTYVYYYAEQEMFYCSTTDGQFTFYDKAGTQLYSKVASYIDPYSAYGFIQVAQMGDYEAPVYGAFDLGSGDDIMPYEFESLYPFWINEEIFFAAYKKGKVGIYSGTGQMLLKHKGTYLDNYYYDSGEYSEVGYYVEISNKKGKAKVIKLNY